MDFFIPTCCNPGPKWVGRIRKEIVIFCHFLSALLLVMGCLDVVGVEVVKVVDNDVDVHIVILNFFYKEATHM